MPIDGEVRRARVALVLLLVVAATAIAVGAHMAATSAAEVELVPPLREGPACDDPPPSPPAATPATIAADGASAAAPITLSIPPTVFVRVDAGGAPVALMTNTECAPRPSDRVLVEVDSRHAIAPVPELVDAVRARAFTGDWSEPGRWRAI